MVHLQCVLGGGRVRSDVLVYVCLLAGSIAGDLFYAVFKLQS